MRAADGAGHDRRILEVEQLVAGYSGQPVLHHVDLHVSPGEVVSLLGANGAGKSTLLKTIMGTVPVIQGYIRLDGHGIAGWAPHKRVAAGIGFSPEGRRVFANLSTEENLLMGAAALPRARKRDGLEHAYHLFPVLAERARQRAGTLSGGEQQMVAIARAMMPQPRLLLVEEPSQGLAPVVVDGVYEALREIASRGVGVLVAEQFQQVHEEASNRILVIDKGTIVADRMRRGRAKQAQRS
ncbi:MAG TPA: ABC transporter ATP-binding protein [Sporichthyaceae bacterium]|nr:ABC transporter ATP-binding protein [Sporichthyaceae bacterium]